MPTTDLLEMLRARPTGCSLIEWNGANHFIPWLYKPTAAWSSSTAIEEKTPSIPPTEIGGDDEMDDEGELEAVADAQQAAARSNHVELNLGLELPPDPSSLAATARETLCRSNVPLSVLHKSHNSLSVLFVSGSGNSFP